MPSFVYPLASGSLGNALLVATPSTRVLVDLGLSRRTLRARLAGTGVGIEDISAVFLTHTHRDHFSASAAQYCLKHRVPVYSTHANLRHLAFELAGFSDLAAAGLAVAINGCAVEVGDITVEAFDVPHDSAGGCLGFRLSSGSPRARRAVTVATDLGHMPPDCTAAFLDSNVVVLESNHDVEMLRSSGRPWELIERIAGPHGHLSNEAAAEALAEIVGRSHPGRVGHVILAHLSRDCNHPRLALAAQAHLARRHTHPIRIATAVQDEAGPRVEL